MRSYRFGRGTPMRISKVRCIEDADSEALKVTLYRKDGLVRGWYVGPVMMGQGTVDIPYAAKSANLMAPVIILRANQVAKAKKLNVCLVDPDNLWHEAWGAHTTGQTQEE